MLLLNKAGKHKTSQIAEKENIQSC